jgi:hypothetical protein
MDNLTPLLADTMALQACRRSRPRQCASARTNPDNPNRTCADPVAAQENALLVGLPPCFNSSSVQMQTLCHFRQRKHPAQQDFPAYPG